MNICIEDMFWIIFWRLKMKLLIIGDIYGRNDVFEKVLKWEFIFDLYLNIGDLGLDL